MDKVIEKRAFQLVLVVFKGLHIVVLYLVLGNWRIPWSFRVYRGKGTHSPSQLASKLLSSLPSILTQQFHIYVLGDTAFGKIKVLLFSLLRQL